LSHLSRQLRIIRTILHPVAERSATMSLVMSIELIRGPSGERRNGGALDGLSAPPAEAATSTDGAPDGDDVARFHRIRYISDRNRHVRVVVADDHPVFREGMVRVLQGSPYVEVVAEAEDGRSALEQTARLQPDVVLLDYMLPGLDGIAVTHAIKRDGLPSQVLILSAHNESGVVFEALQAGAAGFLPKESSREQILDGVLAVARGESVLPPEIAAGLVGEIRLRAPTTGPVLTDREREILRLMADGKSFPEIAQTLYLGVTTVKTHVQHVYEKLGVSDRAGAVAEALRKHLIE
jgi:two-component system nitrate/nitrite response regulator NarL